MRALLVILMQGWTVALMMWMMVSFNGGHFLSGVSFAGGWLIGIVGLMILHHRIREEHKNEAILSGTHRLNGVRMDGGMRLR